MQRLAKENLPPPPPVPVEVAKEDFNIDKHLLQLLRQEVLGLPRTPQDRQLIAFDRNGIMILKFQFLFKIFDFWSKFRFFATTSIFVQLFGFGRNFDICSPGLKIYNLKHRSKFRKLLEI